MGLTIWWQVNIALAGEEVVALPLGLELSPELLGRDLGHRGRLLLQRSAWQWDLLLVVGIRSHLRIQFVIIEFPHGAFDYRIAASRIRIIRRPMTSSRISNRVID